MPLIPSNLIPSPLVPPNPFAERFDALLDREVRPRFFKKMDFTAPAGDPGWFGPDSPVWHVHSHMPLMFFGLSCAAFMENLDPGIAWMGYDHSRIVERVDGVPTGRVDLEGAKVRFAHSLAFFTATAYGPTETAERAARAVRAMHHTIKGTRPDGVVYDADSPEWIRWNYATVVWGIGTAHERYHPKALKGADLDEYYRQFTRVGEALGGTDLPASKGEVLECLEAELPRLALTPIAAGRTWPLVGAHEPRSKQPLTWFVDWAQRDLLPEWAQRLYLYRRPNPVAVVARRQAVWALLNGLHATTGPMREFRQSEARAAAAPGPETVVALDEALRSALVPVPDAPMDRGEVEATF